LVEEAMQQQGRGAPGSPALQDQVGMKMSPRERIVGSQKTLSPTESLVGSSPKHFAPCSGKPFMSSPARSKMSNA
jgi:hypothetical protein